MSSTPPHGSQSTPPPRSNDPAREASVAYNIVADKIGGVPNIRKKDNLIQAAAIGVFVILGVVIGPFFAEERMSGMALGALGGLIVGVLVSGAVLMVIGLFRKP